jgi:hypothetical protein
MRLLLPFKFALLAVMAATLLAEAADKEEIVVDKDKRTITVPCKIAPRKIDDPAYKEIYPIEVVACWPWRKEPPGGQKAHETVVVFDFSIKPSAVHKAVEGFGLKPGKPAFGEGEEGKAMPVGEGPEVKLFLEFDAMGVTKKVPLEKTLVSRDNPKLKLPDMKWRFTGSVLKQPNPDKPEKVYGADMSGTMISIFPVTDQTVFQTQLTMKEEKFIKMETNKNLLPKEGTPCKLIIEVPAAAK